MKIIESIIVTLKTSFKVAPKKTRYRENKNMNLPGQVLYALTQFTGQIKDAYVS
ncbi:hypothetical protein [Methylomonas sp. 11b]|uniref:hypothetical protein n=1 Tax=Methylomonas sp. 11b TaxID=1168169 RepID=UPI0018CC3FF2|nr:hypothetical protein [Methylomonas sp. 11b]